MRKNLALLSIFVILTILTFIFQEKRSIDLQLESDRSSTIFNVEEFGKLMAMSTPTSKIVADGPGFITSQERMQVDEVVLNEVFHHLGSIKIQRFLNNNDIEGDQFSFFFPSKETFLDFEFEKGKLQFLIGSKLNHDQAFYVKIVKNTEKQYLIARMDTALHNAYFLGHDHNSSEHYKKLLEILFLNEEFYYDKRVLQKIPINPDSLISIQFNNFRNRPFSLNPINSTTLPIAPEGIGYNKEVVQKFLTTLFELRAFNTTKKVDLNLLKDELASLRLIDVKENQSTVTLYGFMGDKEGRYVRVSGDDVLYQLQPSMTKIFFMNRQDFWNKTILTDEEQKMLETQGLSIDLGEKDQIRVKYVNSSFVSTDSKQRAPIQGPFEQLLNILIRPADMVEKALESRWNHFTQKIKFKFSIGNFRYALVFENNEVIILDEGQKVTYHYWIGGQDLSLDPNDYFQ